jgi:hypothetical protein
MHSTTVKGSLGSASEVLHAVQNVVRSIGANTQAPGTAGLWKIKTEDDPPTRHFRRTDPTVVRVDRERRHNRRPRFDLLAFGVQVNQFGHATDPAIRTGRLEELDA